ncbi:pimeloyl-ACP methyl ester carboxylesterase [Nocardioides sp. BE266]|uniref:alpha/beta fold hydrolase n=1 Tax=Nocardioides sp. BE266 TaxID=2817725 RepID=UPI002858CB06|nr:alpha/beta hydrolase [Nocardioides sp. BE266]MDR7253131.1 pimeloyl-ACP methyl ester carboxylesterase [Nocardioides sp. BE266]
MKSLGIPGLVLVVCALVGGCGADVPSGQPAPSSVSPDDEGRVKVTEQVYDVDGHGIYMTCSGEGPVTVVFLHGWVDDKAFIPHEHVLTVGNLLVDDYRFCAYDRRNVGSSETVDAPQTPDDVVSDMEGVLAAARVEPPYLLYAGSFGGVVASAYLAKHPDDVVAMVLGDSAFPDELTLDHLLPKRFRQRHFDKEDACCSVERISQYDLYRSLQPTIGHEPAIPVVYLASKQEPWDQNDYESPEYDARILDLQADYVDRFSPGVLHWVDAPHWMEPVVPEVIADAIREADSLRQ